jgi:hypothetical protein
MALLQVNSMVHHFVVVVITEGVVHLIKKVSMVIEVFVVVVDVVGAVVQRDEEDQRVKSLSQNKDKIFLLI